MSVGHKHAVVIGGSIAGLMAARVLSTHFEQVTIVERDTLEDSTEARKGVPQGRHAHGLLARGEEILTTLFPDIVEELVADGAIRTDWARDVKWFHHGAWKVRCESGVMTTALSRPLLELHVRRRVRALRNVQWLTGHEVAGLQADPQRTRVTGVITQRNDEREPLAADLVVDASGRGSRAPHWFEGLGYAAPEESAVEVRVGYASRIYRIPPDHSRDWKALYLVGSAPHGKRMGVISPLEGDRWMVTLAGMLRDYPPIDPSGYLAFARSLPTEDLYRSIRDAEPLSDITAYRFDANLRRHYERLRRAPEGFVVLGDACCSFNPIYGQGMTTAGFGALTLDACLQHRRSLAGFARRFQTKLAAVTDVPWAMTTGEDFRFPETVGKRPKGSALLERYFSRLHKSSAHDDMVLLAFTRAMHMLAPPTSLLTPRIVLRVLFSSGGAN